MKNHLVLKALLIACLLPLLAMLTSCEKSDSEGYTLVDGIYKNDTPTAVVIILGNHANAMAIPEDAYYSMDESLSRAAYGGYVCAIVADATPTKIELIDDRNFFKEDARNSVTLTKRINARKEKVIKSLTDVEISADSPETDLLAALREAKNVLSNNQVEGMTCKQIIVIDTGISTIGDLNFIDLDFVYSRPDVQEIIEQLQKYEGVGVLPDLTGIMVTFIGTADGLAEVAEPQRISTTDKKFIKELWTEVVRACGASDVQFESVAGWDTPNSYTEDTDSEFPYVSVVTFHHDKVIDFPQLPEFDPNSPDPQPSLPEPPVVEIKLESKEVGFRPESAEYLNEESAKKVLRPFAEELEDFFKYYPDEKVWIVGTTATVKKGSTGSVELSLRRAEKVKDTLVTEFGISEEMFVTIGLGAKFPWHVDEFPEGTFDTEIAQANRAVWMLTARGDVDYFNKLKSAYDNNELLPETMEKFSLLY